MWIIILKGQLTESQLRSTSIFWTSSTPKVGREGTGIIWGVGREGGWVIWVLYQADDQDVLECQ